MLQNGTPTQTNSWVIIAGDSKMQCCLKFLESWITRSGRSCTSSEMKIALDDMIDAIMKAEIIAYMVQAQAVAPMNNYIVELGDDAGITELLF